MRMAKLEKPPFRLLGDGIPSAFFLQCLCGSGKRKGFIFAHEGLIALIPNNEHHRRKRDGFFFEYGILAVLDLPLLNENVFVKSTRGRPYVDSLVAIEQGVRTLQ